MKTQTSILWLAVALATTCSLPTVAAETGSLARLDQALPRVSVFEMGKDASPLIAVEQIVFESAKDPAQRAVVEERLLKVLSSSPTREAKEFICRQLFTIGTARCVPALEALLTDPALSHMARFALGRNESPAALEALQRALGKTSGSIQAGILNTLGLRRYDKALPDIQKLVSSPDPEVAKAAARAMGEIGGPAAVKTLQAVRATATEAVRPSIDAALLVSADQFLKAGEAEAAAKIYEGLYVPSQPSQIRLAALRGLAAARQQKAMPLLVEAIRSPDSGLCAAAISFSASVSGPAATKTLADLLSSLPAGNQQLLLNALGQRGDEVAMPAVVACTRSDDATVRTAAYAALGKLGDASAVSLLAKAAADTSGAEQMAARTSLLQLQRRDIDTALVQLLGGGDPKLQTEAVRALAGRHATVAFKDLRKLATAPDPSVRREAIRALGVLANEQTFPELVTVIPELETPEDLNAAAEAVIVALPRIPNPERQSAPMLAALGSAPAESKPTLLQLLSVTGTADALAAVRAALKDSNAAVAQAALRTLADWPDATPADELLELARTSPTAIYKVIALRGYVRMAALSQDPGAMYARALQMAERPEDKKLVLSSLGTAEPNQALKLVEPYLKNEQLRSEAALATVQIADRLRQQDAVRAKAALQEVMSVSADSPIRQQAQEVLNQIEALDAYILEWLGAGPYQEKDKDAHDLFDLALPPETADASGVKWIRLAKGVGAWSVNLGEALGGGDNAVGYVRTRVWSAIGQDARLELSSDDGVKVWLNGAVVHANNVERGLTARQDIVNVKLEEGWNDLLLKVTNAGGGWEVACRIRQPDGRALEGLKFEAKL